MQKKFKFLDWNTDLISNNSDRTDHRFEPTPS